jgi:hypothetical protein
MSRREFNGLCITVGSSLGMVGGMLAVPSGALALDAGTGVVPTGAGRMVKFRDGVVAPALGQGSAQLAVGRRPQAVEEEALRTGLSLGMTLIDTAEMYGDGRSEKFIGRVIAGQRDRVFLVSKVSPSHATKPVSRAKADTGANSEACSEIPYATEQGIISEEQGILAQEQGFCLLKTEIVAG